MRGLLILAVLAVAGLIIAAVVSLTRRRARRALRFSVMALAVVALYTASLFAVSLASTPRTLAGGQWKCFDEWCATLESSSQTSGELGSSSASGIPAGTRNAPTPPTRTWSTTDVGPVSPFPASRSVSIHTPSRQST